MSTKYKIQLKNPLNRENVRYMHALKQLHSVTLGGVEIELVKPDKDDDYKALYIASLWEIYETIYQHQIDNEEVKARAGDKAKLFKLNFNQLAARAGTSKDIAKAIVRRLEDIGLVEVVEDGQRGRVYEIRHLEDVLNQLPDRVLLSFKTDEIIKR
ncbi:hypothetical protein EY268_14735 [Shigella sonnei]|nr:hypothetical protein [Shigella sonnei]